MQAPLTPAEAVSLSVAQHQHRYRSGFDFMCKSRNDSD
jgi:hypothetical protein